MAALIALILWAGLPALAVTVSVEPLNAQERAALNATHVAEIDYADFSESTSNTAETLTMSIAAKQGFEVVALVLDTAFDTGNTNYTGSCALTIGDGTDADLFLESTELASDGTEVWLKYGRATWQTATTVAAVTNVNDTTGSLFATNVSLSFDTTSITYIHPESTTNTLAGIITNVTVSLDQAAAVTATSVDTADVHSALTQSIGQKVYTAADTVDFTFTPNSEEALDDNTSGKVKVYLRIWDAR